jgi:aromatase
MLTTWILFLPIIVIIYVLSRNSTRKKTFPGPRHIISIPTYFLHMIMKISNPKIRTSLMSIFFPESARYAQLTIPLASQYYTSIYGDIVQIHPFNQPTIIISNPDFADHILKRNGKNYTLRFGNTLGLEYLGMANKGIIWNRNVQRWKYQRSNYFQKALNSKILDDAKHISNDAVNYVLKHLQTFEVEPNIIDTLDLLRCMTFSVTCHLFLDLPVGSITIEKTKLYVKSIVEYFKAWEYFLLKPSELYDEKYLNRHRQSINELNKVVVEIISNRQSNNDCLFINSLLNSVENQQITQEEMNQCVLEMLIAGSYR